MLPERPWRTAASLARDGAGLPDWPAEWRASALARLDEAGMPDGSDEEWRYTSLTAWGQRWSDYLAAAGQPAAITLPAVPSMQPGSVARPAAIHVQVVNGALLTQTGATPPGLFVGSLRQLPPELRGRAAELLGKSAGLPPEQLVDLNSALVSDVILIGTDAGTSFDGLPVHIHLQGSGSPAFSHPRILVDVARSSRLTLTIEHSGADGMLANAVTQAWIGHGAHLDLVRVQSLPDDGMLTDTSHIDLAAAASARITSVDLGGLLSRQSMTVVLAGAGSSATVDGLFLADDRRHIDNRTLLEHRAPGTTSRESFRGLADGHGRGIFNGKIIVMPGAEGSNAALSNRNLLLAATAEIDTKPELEIYVDDVKCSHGATTGQLDANALFYLRSRGLDPAAARQVLTAAFLREALGHIALPELRERLEARLQEKLGGGVRHP
ncbi:MAG: Fe-S cluster assembly protein SufD [Chromatiales bacterium]|nr:Fe-S cluster assembly protein SufD [Chromatiales bacterium]